MTATRKLFRRELTAAIARYARRHNHYASTVRTMTVLRLAAIREWLAANVEAAR